MKTVRTVAEARKAAAKARAAGEIGGLVPTMGALHDGHMALVNRARAECRFISVSIFVNPTQFGPSEDLETYPRTMDSDLDKCEQAGVDLVFAPSAGEMYPAGFDTWVEVTSPLSRVLEGEFRPGHFRGVATVCAKLFNILDPDRAYFGLKDYQQLKVIQQMVRDLNLPVQIVPVETVREPDGVAMSSRNVYLSAAERTAARVLSTSLARAREAFEAGERDAEAVRLLVENLIRAEPLGRIDYVAVVDAETLQPIRAITAPAVALVSVRIGRTRLIDNVILG